MSARFGHRTQKPGTSPQPPRNSPPVGLCLTYAAVLVAAQARGVLKGTHRPPGGASVPPPLILSRLAASYYKRSPVSWIPDRANTRQSWASFGILSTPPVITTTGFCLARVHSRQEIGCGNVSTPDPPRVHSRPVAYKILNYRLQLSDN